MWKSEAEYKAYFIAVSNGGSMLNNFEKAMELTVDYLMKSTDSGIISDEVIQKINNDLREIDSKILDQKTKDVQKRDKKLILQVMNCLKEYANEKNMDCDYVILKASQFNSGFAKVDFSQIKIVFPTTDGDKYMNFCSVVSSYDAKESSYDLKEKDKVKDKNNFFYLFYKRKDVVNADLDKDILCRKLLREFL